MRQFLIIAFLCVAPLYIFSQQLQLEKASPFTAVKWEDDQPLVQFENEWYHFEQLGKFSKDELLDFCKARYGSQWKKRFSEDLVEVLKGMGHHPQVEETLLLSKNGTTATYTGTFTSDNRRRSLLFNRSMEASKAPERISATDAIADLRQFEDMLRHVSSYSQLSAFDYASEIHKTADTITRKNTTVDVNWLANRIGKIMAEIGDRHSSVRNESFHGLNHKTYSLRLPFGIATLNKQLIALKKNEPDGSYSYYHETYPYLKSIDGVAIETLTNTYNYRHKKAPVTARLTQGAKAIQNYGRLLFENNMDCPDSVTVVFTDGQADTAETVPLSSENKGYTSKLTKNYATSVSNVNAGDFNALASIVGNRIGYIYIPQMYHYDDIPGLEDFIENTIQHFSDTKALIIDVRNNPGGVRGILQTFAGHIIQPEQSPWVANVAYLRTDAHIEGDERSMSGRYLYRYHSAELSDSDRKAIDTFNKGFNLPQAVDTSKFSGPFYMVLHHGDRPYRQPVYILVNEESFSAASVFTSAFKGLPNVKIVGETSDGSSGNSEYLYLDHSNIRIRISKMLSFQRNGKTLDGNGTIPDLMIPTDEEQILRGNDTQLHQLIETIDSDR